MNCRETKDLFASYMDGLVTGAQAQAMARHLDNCAKCNSQFTSLRTTQALVNSLGRKQPPSEMVSRLRIALARERERKQQPVRSKIVAAWNPVRDRIEDMFQAFMLPATAGLVSAVLCFGFVIGFFAVPSQLAATNDLPSGLFTPAKLMSSPFSLQDNGGPDLPVTVEAYVDSNGRVQDYRIISNESADDIQKLRPQLDNALIFAQFEPAIAFGKPSPSRVVVSFSRVNVYA
jgi:hypothetical protein